MNPHHGLRVPASLRNSHSHPSRPALRRDPIVLILAIGAVWTTVMAAGGAMAMAPIAGWLWLTVLVTARRAATRRRSTHPS